jgi:large subunit ribosomal protein L29
MKAKELKKKKDTELTQLLAKKQEDLRELRFNVSGGGTNKTSAFGSLRKDIARIKTEINERRRKVVSSDEKTV